MITMGNRAKDIVTGFEGVVTGRCEYLYGCTQWGITPAAKDGEIKDTRWFDEGRVQFTGSGVSPEEVQGEKPGPGDAPSAAVGRR